MIDLIVLAIGACWAYGFAEIYLDIKIRDIAKIDGLFTEDEIDLMHGDQLPLRGVYFAVLLVLLCVFDLLISRELSWFEAVGYALLCVGQLWASINVIAAKWMLKKHWYYIGKTDNVNPWFGSPFAVWLSILVLNVLGVYLVLS